jgi:hypothetical protein
MNTAMINIYIEKLLNEVSENTKSRILLETQLKYTEMLNQQLQNQNKELQSKLDKLNINNNPTTRKKTKEVNTSSETF